MWKIRVHTHFEEMAKNLAYKEVEVPYRLPKQPIFKLKSRFIVISGMFH